MQTDAHSLLHAYMLFLFIYISYFLTFMDSFFHWISFTFYINDSYSLFTFVPQFTILHLMYHIILGQPDKRY